LELVALVLVVALLSLAAPAVLHYQLLAEVLVDQAVKVEPADLV